MHNTYRDNETYSQQCLSFISDSATTDSITVKNITIRWTVITISGLAIVGIPAYLVGGGLATALACLGMGVGYYFYYSRIKKE